MCSKRSHKSSLAVRSFVASCCIVVTLICAACNRGEPGAPTLSTPSAPTPAITNYGGSWHGNFLITQCSGRRHCNEARGQQSPFSVLLQQTGARVDGVFQAEGFAIPVEGDVSGDGELTLTGRQASPGWYLPTIELTRFTARRSDTTGLVAELAYRLEYPAGAPNLGVNGSAPQTISGSIVSAALGAPTPRNSFAGAWNGKFLLTDQSTTDWLGCVPESRGEEGVYKLTLIQTGDRVAGELRICRHFNVTGTVSGDTLTLDPTVSSTTDSWHLLSWTMTKDAVGQVRGNMAYEYETLGVPSLNRPPYVSRYRADILYGILEP